MKTKAGQVFRSKYNKDFVAIMVTDTLYFSTSSVGWSCPLFKIIVNLWVEVT